MLGYWDTPDLLEVIRLFVLNMQVLQNMGKNQSFLRLMAGKLFHLLRQNSLTGSKRNISAHYDLSNRFFSCSSTKPWRIPQRYSNMRMTH